jgi:hypothetical protein
MSDGFLDSDAEVEWNGIMRWYHENDLRKIYYPFTGNTYYYLKCKRHRLDGPAIVYKNSRPGDDNYFLNGIKIDVKSQKEFKQYQKLVAFI